MMVRRWTTLAGSTLLMAALLSGCPEKKAAPDEEKVEATEEAAKVEEGSEEAKKEEAAPAPPPIPEGVEHLKNEKWVDSAPPTEIPEVDTKPGTEAYGVVAGKQEAALTKACTADVKKVLQLDPEVSRVGFVSYKNEELPIPGKIGDVHGFAVLGEKPSLSFWANVLTVNTGSKGRDARLASLFFEGEKGANSVVTFEASSFEGLPAALPTEEGAAIEVKVKGALTLHGKTVDLEVPLTITRQGNAWKAEEKGVTLIQFAPFELIKPLGALLAACNHKAMGTAVALELDLRIVPGC